MRNILSRKSSRRMNRSGRFPCGICGEKTILVEHHVDGRNTVMKNRMFNRINICPNCHMQIHSGNIVVEDVFMTTMGYRIIWRRNGDMPITGRENIPHIMK